MLPQTPADVIDVPDGGLQDSLQDLFSPLNPSQSDTVLQPVGVPNEHSPPVSITLDESAYAQLITHIGSLTATVQRLSEDQTSIKNVIQNAYTQPCLQPGPSEYPLPAVGNVPIQPSYPYGTPGYTPSASPQPGIQPGPYAGAFQGQVTSPGQFACSFPYSRQTDALERAETLFTGARVSAKVLVASRAGEYVSLNDFIPDSEPSTEMETAIVDNSIVVRPKKTKRSLDNFYIWSQSWSGYESVLLAAFPNHYVSLCKYRLYIQELDQQYKWPAVSAYDKRHRLELSRIHSINFDVISMDILVSTCMTTGATKEGVGCYRCQSPKHFVKNCPFRDDDEKGQSKEASQTNASQSQKFSANQSAISKTPKVQTPIAEQICFRWNGGRCFTSNCPRRHVCQNCKQVPEPYLRCHQCSVPGSAPRNAFSTGPQNMAQTFTPPPR